MLPETFRRLHDSPVKQKNALKKLEEISHILKIPVERQLKTTELFLNNHHKLNLLPLGKETFPKPSAIKMKV